MNLFDQAKLKYHIKTLPTHYKVSNNEKVFVSYIIEIWIGNMSYMDNIYGSDFNNRKDFENFIFNNFNNITKIISSNSLTRKEYILKNGLLHDPLYHSLTVTRNKITTYYYYLNGLLYSDEDFLIEKRILKINKILNHQVL
jgi:hypothetical protein